MSQLKRLTNPDRAVLGTYLHRPLFRLCAVLYLAYCFEQFGLIIVADAFHVLNIIGASLRLRRLIFTIIPPDPWRLREISSLFIDPLFQLAFPIGVGVAWIAHLREQLAGFPRVLVPNYIRPTLRSASIAAAIAFVAISVVPVMTEVIYTFIDRFSFSRPDLLPSAWEDYRWSLYGLPGGLIVTCTAMTVAAWCASFGKPWISLALAPILWVTFLATNINPGWFYYNIVRDNFYATGFYSYPLRFFYYYLIEYKFFLLFICVPVLFNTIALIALNRRINRMAAARLMDSASPIRQSPSASIILHRPTLSTAWSRLSHIRSAGISATAPWIVALLLAVVLMLIPPLLISSHHPEMQTQISLILATILPSVAVALLWAERWPRLGVESLLPASRRQFVAEIIAAMGIDLFHFWIAIAITASLPLLMVPLKPLDVPMFAERLLASGLMQLIAFAALLWAMWLRSWPSLMGLLGLAIAAMAGPLSYSTKLVPVIPVSTLVPLSLVMGFLGITLSAIAYHRWLRGNWV